MSLARLTTILSVGDFMSSFRQDCSTKLANASLISSRLSSNIHYKILPSRTAVLLS
jgi:hypothetical protein